MRLLWVVIILLFRCDTMQTQIITGESPTSWAKRSISAYVPVGTNVILCQVVNLTETPIDFHFRATGGAETAPILIEDSRSKIVSIPISANLEFDYYLSSGSVDVWLLDYSTTSAIAAGTYYSDQGEVYAKAQVTSSQIATADVYVAMRDTDAWIDELYGKSFHNAQAQTDWFDTDDESADWETETIPLPNVDRIFLTKRPVQSITSLQEYDTSNTLVKTYATSEYWLESSTGIITLIEDTFLNQRHRVKVVYTYGYSSTPTNIRHLANVQSAIFALREHLAKKWEMPTSVGLPNDSQGGSIQDNIIKTIKQLEREKGELLNTIGRLKLNVVVI